MRTWNFKISDFPWLTKDLPNSLYHFWNNLAYFLKIMHHSSMPWQITVDPLKRARIKLSTSSVKLQCKSWSALASIVLPYPSLHCFAQPTLPYLALLCYTYLLICIYLFHKLMKYTTEMWKFSLFHSNFWSIFADALCYPFIHTLICLEVKCAKVVHMSCKFHLYLTCSS